jgi:hypothetical protein
MRAAERAQIDDRQVFLVEQIDLGDGVQGAAAVIGDVGRFSVGRGDHFMRIGAGGNAANDRQCFGIDDGHGLIVFGEHEKRLLGCFGGLQECGESTEKNCGERSSRNHILFTV